ncbi:hypothetical protein LCGC14_1705030 [marine sediment metagenome]|uniref:Uncharacterized protein n=1 Tax=marine sediment metagenome TaxID=412755 RepID=A0A0F9HHE1_9ZZZZ
MTGAVHRYLCAAGSKVVDGRSTSTKKPSSVLALTTWTMHKRESANYSEVTGNERPEQPRTRQYCTD